MKLRLFFLNILLSLHVFGQTVPPKSADYRAAVVYNRCYSNLNKTTYSVWKNCYKCADSAYAIDSSTGFYLRKKCIPAVKLGEYENFMKIARQAINKDKQELQTISYHVLYYLKDYPLALSMLKEYDALTPSDRIDDVLNDNLLSLYGICYSQLNQYDSAIMYLDSLINHGEDETRNFKITHRDYFNRGVAHYKKGHYELAIKDFQKAIQEFPNYVEAYYYQALTQKKLNQPKLEVQENLKLALEYFDKGYRNTYPLLDYVDLPNQVYKNEIQAELNALEK